MKKLAWKIPLFKIFWDDKDVEAVSKVIRRGMYWTSGPESNEFENMLADYIGTRCAVVFNSGTTALHAAILAHKIHEGDEVIVPSFTFIATANAVLFAGAKPVFADIETKTFGLDPDDVKEKITGKTKAIIPVHYGGSPCMIRELKEIAEDHNLLLIEDAAESMGARVKDKKVGTFGDSAMLSFCQNKVITTGDGGAVVTDSKEIYERLKMIRSHGRIEKSGYFASRESGDYVVLGYNYRMSDITAALGISQLAKIEEIIKMRRDKANYMSENLSKIKNLSTPKPLFDYHFHVYQMYTVRVLEGKKTRDDLANHLAEKGVMTKIYFSPIHLTHFYKKELKYNCKLPVTEEMSERVLTLPLYPSLTIEEMDYMVDEIKAFISGCGCGIK
jgi:perosamine synthetase